MVVVLRTLFRRDLRGNWVFPRLAYAATTQAIERGTRRVLRCIVTRPRNRMAQLIATLRDHRDFAEVFLAVFALLTASVRAVALLLAAVALLILAISRF